MIQQLRERNFILCYRGADTYGFVHRTFLEYFCAVEIVQQFEKQRSLSFEQLRDEVFGQHWQDETWHEVLRLICNMINTNFAEMLIDFLMKRECDRTTALEEDVDIKRLKPEGLTNLLLSADCWLEIRPSKSISSVGSRLFDALKREIENPDTPLGFYATESILYRIIFCFPNIDILPWLKTYAQQGCDWRMREVAICVIAELFSDEVSTLSWLEDRCRQESDGRVRWTTLRTIVRHFRNTPEHLSWLKAIAQRRQENRYLRQAAIKSIADYFSSEPTTLLWLKEGLEEEQDPPIRWEFIRAIIDQYDEEPETLPILKKYAENDENQWVRSKVIQGIIELLERANNDPDEHLREWAQEQLKMQNEKSLMEDTQ